MEEAYLHLPVRDNDGRCVMGHVDQIEAEILKAFGGFTHYAAFGVWRDPETGKVYDEPVRRYAVAADWNDERNIRHMRLIARHAAYAMRQECIYLAWPIGVEFVKADMGEMAIAAE